MSRRQRVYAVLIALLLLGNLLRWGYTALGAGSGVGEGARTFEAREFELRASVPAAAEPSRDLFAAQADAMPAPRAASRSAQPRPPIAPAPLAPEVDAAAAGLGRLRLLGVVVREGRSQAYLALDKSSVIAQGGDTVFGRYVVERIGVDAVELRDLQTNNTRKIAVSGR